MYMKDWIAKLDDFLKLSDRNILAHAGSITHELAVAKAEAEYEVFHRKQLAEPSNVEKHFEAAVKKLETIKPPKSQKKGRKK